MRKQYHEKKKAEVEAVVKKNKPVNFTYKGYRLTEQEVLEAMKNSRSNLEAARWLDVDSRTWEKYAKHYIDLETGKSLYELHCNKSGKGKRKIFRNREKVFNRPLDELLKENKIAKKTHVALLRSELLKDGRLGFQCSCCKFAERRISDSKSPLLLNFKNGKKTDWRIENLRWLCYNCSFLLGIDYFSQNTTQEVEGFNPELTTRNNVDTINKFYDLDEILLSHFKEVGLNNEIETQREIAINKGLEEADNTTNTDIDIDDLISYV